ncbi:DUF6903 family protein [Peptoniphilaceae bacterium SGI.131]
MDYYKKKKIGNVILSLIFIIALILQVVGHANNSYYGLLIQFISVGLLIFVLYLYNKRHK